MAQKHQRRDRTLPQEEKTVQISKPLRILHVAFTMHARGTESWLMHVLRGIDRNRFQLDFLTIEGEEGIYDEEIKSLGGQLFACPHPKNKGTFLRSLRGILEKEGPFDIIHAHPFTLSGLILMQAMRAHVPVRIVHSHTDRRKVTRDKSFFRRVYGGAMRKLIDRTATYGLAASPEAALSLFGKNWQSDQRWNVMHCGIDLKPFEKTKDKNEIRNAIGIPNKAKVIGHVGSFHFEKNHEFLFSLFKDMAQSDLTLHLLLIGDGPLKHSFEERVRNEGLEARVTFTGAHQDVPDLLQAMDVFAFPSLFEGLGLATIEAQASGLPCLLSDQIPQEAAVAQDNVRFIPLENSMNEWKRAIKEALKQEKLDKQKALTQVQASSFNIDHNIVKLCELYESLCQKERANAA